MAIAFRKYIAAAASASPRNAMAAMVMPNLRFTNLATIAPTTINRKFATKRYCRFPNVAATATVSGVAQTAAGSSAVVGNC